MDTEQAADKKASTDPDLVTLHPDGDATLVIFDSDYDFDRRFLVSSAVLRIASPVFRVLLTSTNFKEGLDVQQGLIPEIRLEEDDAAAMRVMLSILHFKNSHETKHESMDYLQLVPRMVAKVAVQCDKYDCIEPMKPWISVWLSAKNDIADEDVGLLLSAAYNFNSPSHFRHLSAIAMTQIDLRTAAKWPKEELIISIPERLLDMEASTIPSLSDQRIITIRKDKRSVGSTGCRDECEPAWLAALLATGDSLLGSLDCACNW